MQKYFTVHLDEDTKHRCIDAIANYYDKVLRNQYEKISKTTPEQERAKTEDTISGD